MSLFGAQILCCVQLCAPKWCCVGYIILYARWYLICNIMKSKENIKLACYLQSSSQVVLDDSTASKN